MYLPKLLGILIYFISTTCFCFAQNLVLTVDTIPYDVYPLTIEEKPDLPSPFRINNGEEYLLAVTKDDKYAIIRVTLSNDRGIGPQLIADNLDFPELAETGMHSEERLDNIKTITGRSIEEISELGRPNGLSQAGFMAHDENIISVIKGDNRLVSQLGFTHPQLAKPLFHILNMMDTDLNLNRWNMAKHRWENIQYFFYHDQKVFVEAEDTKGGQKSIFDDDIEGSFYIRIWRKFNSEEIEYLEQQYSHLSETNLNDFKNYLSVINTGEMEPQYIMRYGFYEGHTYWRTDPIAISFIFGLISLQELDKIFDNKLQQILTNHFLY
jgi:hypothetical protein